MEGKIKVFQEKNIGHCGAGEIFQSMSSAKTIIHILFVLDRVMHECVKLSDVNHRHI